MTVILYILEAIIIVLSLILIVSVALQKSKSEGITGVTANSETDNFYGKGKESSNEAKLDKITKICTIAFVVVSLIITIMFSMLNASDSTSTDTGSETTETSIITESETAE